MKNKTTYKIQHLETGFDAVVQIEHDHPELPEALKQAVEFWGNWEDRLDDCEGDYLQCFLKQLGRKMVLVSLSHGLTLAGMLEYMASEEGYPPLDGSFGITLASVDEADVGLSDIYVEQADQ